ncbi:hypothetical protein [Rhodocytophaga aerolata]|uniref:hypothetical protein n=1 Tax=Rhodocytophaga aerolata TaxID=455078 RepID=UPI00366E71B4
MNPVHSRSTRNTLVCPVCKKEFYACRSDKKTCSSRCKHKLHLQTQQMEAARKMTQEIKDLYQSYRLKEQTKSQQVIF